MTLKPVGVCERCGYTEAAWSTHGWCCHTCHRPVVLVEWVNRPWWHRIIDRLRS